MSHFYINNCSPSGSLFCCAMTWNKSDDPVCFSSRYCPVVPFIFIIFIVYNFINHIFRIMFLNHAFFH